MLTVTNYLFPMQYPYPRLIFTLKRMSRLLQLIIFQNTIVFGQLFLKKTSICFAQFWKLSSNFICDI